MGEHRSTRGERRRRKEAGEPQLHEGVGEQKPREQPGHHRVGEAAEYGPSGLLSGVVALATLAGVGVAALQWSTIKAQTDLTAESVRLARVSAESTQRAWSLIDNIRPVRTFEPGRSNLFEIITKNYGHTPARGGIVGVGSILPVGEHPPNVDDKRSTAIIIEGPGQKSYAFAETNVINQETIDAIHRGDQVMWVSGLIHYADPFGDHRTRFCARWDLKRNHLSACEFGNTAD